MADHGDHGDHGHHHDHHDDHNAHAHMDHDDLATTIANTTMSILNTTVAAINDSIKGQESSDHHEHHHQHPGHESHDSAHQTLTHGGTAKGDIRVMVGEQGWSHPFLNWVDPRYMAIYFFG